MTFEIVTKAIEEHGAAVNALSKKVDQSIATAGKALERVEMMEEKGVRLRGIGAGTSRKSPVQTFIKSNQLASMRDGAQSTGRVELQEVSIKSLVNTGRGQEGDSEYSVQADRGLGVRNDPRLALQLLDALPSIQVSASTYEYTKLDTFDNNADYQAVEGTLKASSGMGLVQATANIETLAHWTRASVQVLADEPSLQSYIGNLLGYGLLAKLENEIINGAGGTGKILGLLPQAAAFAPTLTDSATDRIGAATAAMKAEGWKPSMILINPLDWFEISKSKATGDGQYLLGSPQNPASANLWGNAVVESPGLARGTVLLIDPANVAILDRMQPVVIATRFDRDNLVTNLVTLLAELRAGLAVFAQDAVRSVDIATTA